MVSQIRPVTAEEFDQFVRRPEHADRNFELIAGEIVEKMVSHPCSSIIAAWIIARLSMFADEHDLGWVSGADGGYVVNYLADGTIVWIVDPGKRVEVHRPGQRVQILGADDTLECGIFS